MYGEHDKVHDLQMKDIQSKGVTFCLLQSKIRACIYGSYLARFEDVVEGLSLHEEKLFGEVGLEELQVADAVAVEGEGRLVRPLLLVWSGQILRHVHAHMERLEPLCEVLYRHIPVVLRPVAPVLLLILP